MAYLGIILLSAGALLAFLFNWWPSLRGDYGWRWPYVAPSWARLSRLLPTLLLLLIYGVGLYFLRKRATWLYLLWVFGGALLLPVALLYWWGDPLSHLFRRTISGMTTGWLCCGFASDRLAGNVKAVAGIDVHLGTGFPAIWR
ncbi:MAG: hypothetical protein M5U34_14230 [Chloroflexi bacterium]|nr:hypothetical protein [Chloroflexota bacterium]